MIVVVEVTQPAGTEPADINIEEVWDHFFFQTPEGTRIKVSKIENGELTTFE